MTIISKLASSIRRRDEEPNIELADKISKSNDKKAIAELIENLNSADKGIQNDCIKVLYEVGERKPSLIAGHTEVFMNLLDHKNNRLQWGAMTAINSITLENPKLVYSSISRIISAADNGSVITKDYAVNILIKLCSLKQHAESAFTLLNEQLLKCPTNQLPMYAEKAISIITGRSKSTFIKTLTSRLSQIEKETKRKRVEKVIRKLELK